jgi:pimeloyl-ACP methyl ester carboxylesterase
VLALLFVMVCDTIFVVILFMPTRILFLFVCALGIFALSALPAQASHCPGYEFQASGYFFDDLEHVEYVDGLLVVHFKLKTPFNDGREWNSTIHILSDTCTPGTPSPLSISGIFLTPGAKFFSIRFSSPTHFDIWNDETNTKETCGSCSIDIRAFATYYELSFSAFTPDRASSLTIAPYRIRESGADAPVYTSILPTPEGCHTFEVQGYYYDEYEHAEYVDGLLVVHFRLKTPFNDARETYSAMRLYDEDCRERGKTASLSPPLNTEFTPYMRYYSVRFASPTHFDIWNDETNTKETCAGCSVNVPSVFSDGSPLAYVGFAGRIGSSFMNATPFPIQESTSRDPIVIVPGIGASWNWDVMLHGVLTSNWDFTPGTHHYDGMIAALESLGYERDKDLFVAFYDWRKPNDIASFVYGGNSVINYLMPTIDKAKEACSCDKVDIIAHSMGGLVARSYIQSTAFTARGQDVDQLFLIGTPSYGSSDVYTLWQGGHIPRNWNAELQSALSNYIWAISDDKEEESEDLDNYNTIHDTVPSVQELLPTYNYVQEGGALRETALLHEQNPLLSSLNSELGLLTSRVRVYTVAGVEQNTVHEIPVIARNPDDAPLWVDGEPSPFNPELNSTEGDNRVLLSSAQLVGIFDSTQITSGHAPLVDASQEYVAQKLGLAPLRGDFPSKHYAEVASYIFASPVQVAIIDPLGNVLSKDAQDIPNSQYSGENDPQGMKWLVIGDPLPGQYTIELTGIGEGGQYHIFASQTSQEDNEQVVAAGEIAAGQIITYTSAINTETFALLLEPEDTTPPTITIHSPQARDYTHLEDIVIDVDIIDEESGVVSQTILLDGIEVYQHDIMSLLYKDFGEHVLDVEAQDSVGNYATSSAAFSIVASQQSLLDLIDYLFEQGWIDNKGIANSLTKKVDNEQYGAFMNELQALREKHITEQAYQLLLKEVTQLL